MSKGPIIVTGCDHAQFRLAWGLLRSLARSGIRTQYAIGFVDGGLHPRERAALAQVGVEVARAGWDFDFPARTVLERTAPGLCTLYGKLHLRTLFPGHDVYVWLDADTWIQDAAAIPIIVDAARERGLAGAYELDRAYFASQMAPHVWSKYREWYGHAFGPATARTMELKPMFNVGVYGIAAGAPHWSVWEWLYRAGLAAQTEEQLPSVFMTDQLAINVAIHHHRLPVALLPATFNWLCHLCPPMWDAEARRLVVPAPPWEPVRIVHLSGSSKRAPLVLRGRRGGRYGTALRYPLEIAPVADDAAPAVEAAADEEVEA
ncbi:hypothetical protein [Stella sp.]|uniref:hypothetical protein n=1 Tax=Stella sp. TaxID=2912054 RepID=UPI0035B4C24E